MNCTDEIKKWTTQPYVSKIELYVGHCDDEPPYAPNYISGCGRTSCYILQYVPSGKGKFIIDGKTYLAKAGDLFLVFPGEYIMEIADAKEPWHFLFFQFAGDSARELLSITGLSEKNRVMSGCQYTCIPNLMREMVQAAHDISNPFRLSLMSYKCFEVFYEIARVYSTQETTYQPPTLRSNYAQQIAYYLFLNFSNKNLSIDSASSAIGLNRSYLYKVFKEATGMSPQTYLMQIRINKACELLAVPGNDVTSVAYAVGYEPNSFSRAFKSITGLTPLEYKKKSVIDTSSY